MAKAKVTGKEELTIIREDGFYNVTLNFNTGELLRDIKKLVDKLKMKAIVTKNDNELNYLYNLLDTTIKDLKAHMKRV